MKRINLLLMSLMLVLVSVTSSWAVGSWSSTVEIRKSMVNGMYISPTAQVWEFTGDAANGTVPQLVVPDFGGKIVLIEYERGTPAPTATMVATFKTMNDITFHTSAAIATSSRPALATPIYIAGGFKLDISATSVNLAKCKIILYIEHF